MVVEIKSTDTPEERDEKLRAVMDASAKRRNEVEREKRARLMKLFGTIKFDGDPVELQRKWRDEWD